ncbi:T9SS type A sorting domain-containing protein [Aureivirga marina]|uniref:T9SS type A sorting domain-containing protein n=1 Tax=Aureivirga marina TaxID=1182451 RepID=UPI0018C9BDED|nr:T9SS type A sorting domain-containing protein [Aureivirga marina]
MKKITLLLFIFSIFSFGQENWRFEMLTQEKNFESIHKDGEKELSNYLENVRSLNRKNLKKVKQFERWKYFWETRVDASNNFVNPLKNYKEWNLYIQNKANKREVNEDNDWVSLGPNEIPESTVTFYAGLGRLNVVTFDPSNANVLWVGSPGGGIWKSEDQGATWISKGDTVTNLGVSDIAVDPNNSDIIYVATGDFDGMQNRSFGVLKSTDGGETWNLTGLNFDVTQDFLVAHIVIDPNNSNILFATTNTAIYKSTDAGANWTSKETTSGGFNDILFKKGDASIMFATSNSGSFYSSADSGETWDESTQNFGSGRLDIALTENDSNFIFAITSNDFYKSSNGGVSWSTVNPPDEFNTQGNYNQTVTIAPNNKNLILVGGVNGHRSMDGGANWEVYLNGYWTPSDPFFYVHSDHHDLKFLPGSNTTVFSANDGGLNKGDITSSTPWVDLSGGLAITQYYKLAVTPQNKDFILAGAQDNDVTQYNGNDWINRNYGTDGVEAVWNYSNSNVAWTCSQFGYVERTTNGWATDPQVLNTPFGNSFVWPLEIHPTIPTILFGGFSNIYKSTNSGTSWTNLSSPTFGVKVLTIAPSNPNIIYIASNTNLYRTTNGGSSWQTITQPSDNRITSIAVNSTNPNEVYITYSGYTAGEKVYKSTNSGGSWTNISGSLPNIPMHKILYETGGNGNLYLGTDVKVFRLNQQDVEGDWEIFGNGLPNVIVNDMEIFYGEVNRLRIATFGRGIWDIVINSSINTPEFEDNLFSVYPNPSSGNFVINFPPEFKEKSIIIYNRIGGVVYHSETKKEQVSINLENVATGLYLVKISSEGREKTQKLVIE